MPKIKLVAVDEDGTFLRDHAHYDKDRFARVFARMTELGVRFVVATGNQRYQVEGLFAPYVNSMGIVSASGAYVTDAGEDVFVACADVDAVRHMIAACHADPTVPFAMVCATCAYVERGTSQEFFDDMARYCTRIRWVNDFSDVDDTVLMFSSVVEEERAPREISRYREVAAGRMDVVSSGDGYFDVMIPGMNKAMGLGHLLDRYGVAPEECVAFGDSDNDLEMLHFVGCGYAMQNAPKHVRDAADRIAPPCTEDGVLQVLEALFS